MLEHVNCEPKYLVGVLIFLLQKICITDYFRCRPLFFELSYFLHTSPLIYAETSLVLHFGKKINKVRDKLLEQLLVLPAAKLKTACTKLVFFQVVHDQT